MPLIGAPLRDLLWWPTLTQLCTRHDCERKGRGKDYVKHWKERVRSCPERRLKIFKGPLGR